MRSDTSSVGRPPRFSSPIRRALTVVRRAIVGVDLAREPEATPYPHVELNYWRPRGWVNFGDELSRTVVSLMLARRGMTLQDEVGKPRQLLAIGSIMHYARAGAAIWGTGINGDRDLWRPDLGQLDVRAVRGPLTRQLLGDAGVSAPPIYGDPALLLPTLLAGRFERKRRGTIYVPHLTQADAPPTLPAGVTLVDPRASWNSVVEAICGAEFVLSSSLHGLVVADAFAVPSRHVQIPTISQFKYEDYYQGTGRPRICSAPSVTTGLSMGADLPAHFDAEALADAFPYDLWSARPAPSPRTIQSTS